MDLWELEFFKNLLSCVLQREKRVFCEKIAKNLQKIFLPAMGCNCLSKPHLWELEFFKNLLNCLLQVFCDFRVLQDQHVSIVCFPLLFLKLQLPLSSISQRSEITKFVTWWMIRNKRCHVKRKIRASNLISRFFNKSHYPHSTHHSTLISFTQ